MIAVWFERVRALFPQRVAQAALLVLVAVISSAGVAALDIVIPPVQFGYAQIIPLLILTIALGRTPALVAAIPLGFIAAWVEWSGAYSVPGSSLAFNGAIMSVVFMGVVVLFDERRRLAVSSVRDEERIARLVERSSLTEAIPTIAWTIRPEGVLLSINRELTRVTGLRYADLRSNWRRAIHPDDVERVGRSWAAARRSFGSLSERVRVRTHDGRFVDYIITIAPIRNVEGKTVQWLGTAFPTIVSN